MDSQKILHHVRARGAVRARSVRERFLREEGGLTMVEMMITVLVMVPVLMALYSIFDMSVRSYMIGNNKTEAVQSARLGLEKMEREIRAAYPVDASVVPAARVLFFSANGTSPPPPLRCPRPPGSPSATSSETKEPETGRSCAAPLAST